MLILPAWHGSDEFNQFMGAALLVAALVAKDKYYLMEWLSGLENKGYVIALEIAIRL